MSFLVKWSWKSPVLLLFVMHCECILFSGAKKFCFVNVLLRQVLCGPWNRESSQGSLESTFTFRGDSRWLGVDKVCVISLSGAVSGNWWVLLLCFSVDFCAFPVLTQGSLNCLSNIPCKYYLFSSSWVYPVLWFASAWTWMY